MTLPTQSSPDQGDVVDAVAWSGESTVTTSDVAGGESKVNWCVRIQAGPSGIVCRTATADGEPWDPESPTKETIWPAWSPEMTGGGRPPRTALAGVHDYWTGVGDRVRESAKWLSTVVGATLAVLAGSTPLAEMSDRPPNRWWGLAGLLLIGATLMLVLRVLQPTSVSFADVQLSNKSNKLSCLGRWKKIVESQPDLYLPSGVRNLEILRKAMVVEAGQPHTAAPSPGC